MSEATATPSTATRTITIDASLDEVWAIVGDPARYGEFSPENVGANVDGPLAVGDIFEGANERGDRAWTTSCEVTDLRDGEVISFHVGDDELGTTWTFAMRQTGDEVEVTQSFDSLRLRHPDWVEKTAGRHEQLVADMDITLAGIKEEAEARR